MGSKFEDPIYRMLSCEPVTPNEIANEFKISHKTALRALMHLALTKEDVYYKNSGRTHLFWSARARRLFELQPELQRMILERLDDYREKTCT